jgi:hypothetical protein
MRLRSSVDHMTVSELLFCFLDPAGESWLYQMPRMGSAGDAFVSVPLPAHCDRSGESPTGWLIAVGEFGGLGTLALA